MAILRNGILGAAHNKIGNIITSSWKGINYAREYVIPKNPNTDAQKVQRGYVRTEGKIASTMLVTVCQKFWDPIARQMSGYNRMVGDNLVAMKAGKELKETVRGIGSLEGTVPTQGIYNTTSGDCTMGWDKTCLANGLATDKLVMIVYDKVNNKSWVSDAIATREDEVETIAIGAGRTATDLVGWIFFYRGSKKPYLISPSNGFDIIADI